MANWTFFDYVSERGVNEIDAWLDSLPPKAAAKVEWLVSNLRGVPRLTRPYVGTRAKYPSLYELVVDAGGRALRPLCCYGPDLRQVTILIGAEEKDGELIPKHVERTAEQRRLIILADRTRVIPHE
ncbi:MAG TPA: type II toxin-antitoxin system RelE/ParE family toxin [Thermoanaerobaculia bacterium]|nr:type II toxin-antitoxin system RelE/ParE family toxin [Thermoanaerobaculia bacterium]